MLTRRGLGAGREQRILSQHRGGEGEQGEGEFHGRAGGDGLATARTRKKRMRGFGSARVKEPMSAPAPLSTENSLCTLYSVKRAIGIPVKVGGPGRSPIVCSRP